MSVGDTAPDDGLSATEMIRANWVWVVLLGIVLIVAGAVAILIPAVSEVPPSSILGSVLVISGAVQVVQSAKMASWNGFIWQMLLGLVATVGGALIYMDPFAGVITLTVLISIIFAAHGVTQIFFGMKVRHQEGWFWFPASGCVALLASVLMLVKLPYSHSFTPATIAGVSIAFAGWAYVAIALASRKPVK